MLHHHNRVYVAAVDTELIGPAEPDGLFRAIRAGDRTAWSRPTHRSLASRVRSVTRAHRLNAHDADDVMQTTRLRLLEHVDDIREPAAVGAWIDKTDRPPRQLRSI